MGRDAHSNQVVLDLLVSVPATLYCLTQLCYFVYIVLVERFLSLIKSVIVFFGHSLIAGSDKRVILFDNLVVTFRVRH